ncbi:MAG TPA: FmdB family zinc ribbon protein [Thermoanaerobaculia bacterium]|jgi:putative FmdB family regulatory protein
MPIYEYVCDSCRRKTEAIQRVGERPLTICPHCGGRLRKAFSAPAIQFKGSGWYVTDYARAKKEEKKEATGDEAKETGEKTEKAEKKEPEKPKKPKVSAKE